MLPTDKSWTSGSEKENDPVLFPTEVESLEPLESPIPQTISFDHSRSTPNTCLNVTREDITTVAARLSRKRHAPSDSSDTDSEYNYLLGPTSKRRKKDNPKYREKKSPQSKRRKPSPNTHCARSKTGDSLLPIRPSERLSTPPSETKSTSSAVSSDSRTMVKAKRAASKMQKLFLGYPRPDEPYPGNFSLVELCSQYPNHLFGANLHPFLQHGWSAGQICLYLPSQQSVVEGQRITSSAIASRLRKVKAALQRSERYDEMMQAEKTHAEGTSKGEAETGVEQGNGEAESGQTQADRGLSLSPGPVAGPYVGIFDQYRYRCNRPE